MVELLQLTEDFKNTPNKPGWVRVVEAHTNTPVKPIIRCNCGLFVGLRLHHVHSDGTVTASFYHKRGKDSSVGESPDGCEWHVFLKLLDYNDGDFPPQQPFISAIESTTSK